MPFGDPDGKTLPSNFMPLHSISDDPSNPNTPLPSDPLQAMNTIAIHYSNVCSEHRNLTPPPLTPMSKGGFVTSLMQIDKDGLIKSLPIFTLCFWLSTGAISFEPIEPVVANEYYKDIADVVSTLISCRYRQPQFQLYKTSDCDSLTEVYQRKGYDQLSGQQPG